MARFLFETSRQRVLLARLARDSRQVYFKRSSGTEDAHPGGPCRLPKAEPADQHGGSPGGARSGANRPPAYGVCGVMYANPPWEHSRLRKLASVGALSVSVYESNPRRKRLLEVGGESRRGGSRGYNSSPGLPSCVVLCLFCFWSLSCIFVAFLLFRVTASTVFSFISTKTS